MADAVEGPTATRESQAALLDALLSPDSGGGGGGSNDHHFQHATRHGDQLSKALFEDDANATATTNLFASSPSPSSSTSSTPPLSSTSSVDASAAAAAAADCSHNAPLSSATLPALLSRPVDAARLLACHQGDTKKYSIGRTALLLGEAHVGKHTFISTIESLQVQSHAHDPNTDAMDSDQLTRCNQTRLDVCRHDRSWWARFCRHYHQEQKCCTDDVHCDRRQSMATRSLCYKTLTATNERICSLDLTFKAQNTHSFSVARLLESNDYELLTNEYRQWHSASFFLVLFSVYDAGSFLAAVKWIDFVTALLTAENQMRQRLAHTDGTCRAWLVGTWRTLPDKLDADTDIINSDVGIGALRRQRAVHRTVASTLAQQRNMRYVELDVCSFLDVEKLCQEMFAFASKLSIEKHLLSSEQPLMASSSSSPSPRRNTTIASSSSSSPATNHIQEVAKSSSSPTSSLWSLLVSSVLPRTWLCIPSSTNNNNKPPTAHVDDADIGGPNFPTLQLSADDFGQHHHNPCLSSETRPTT